MRALSRYSVHTVNLDKAFAQDLTRYNADVDYFTSIVSGIRSLGKEVVLEEDQQ